MVKRNSSRLGGNRPRTHPSPKRKNRSTTATADQPPLNPTQQAAQELKFMALRLRHSRAVAVTAVAALWHQNADYDADIALVLQHSVASPLSVEIERLEAIEVKLLAA